MRLVVEAHIRGKSRARIEDEDGKLIASEVGDLADGRERKRVADALHVAVPGMRRESIEAELLASARSGERGDEPMESPIAPTEEASTEQEIKEAREILRACDLIEQIERDLTEFGIAGEDELKLTLYVVGTSRLLPEPLHAIVHGDSASGKSLVVRKVAALMPPEAIKKATHLSPKALYRMPDLRHKFLVLGERSRQEGPQIEDATKALREFRSDGAISLSTVVEGRLAEFTVEGPVASVETTTKQEIFEEDANRCVVLCSNESAEQSARITALQAQAAVGGVSRSIEGIRRRHLAMQRILSSIETPDVVIPFALDLDRAMTKERVQIRRAFPMLLSTIKACALLHAFQRSRDECGRIIADWADYALARRLIGPSLAASIGGAPSERLRRFFNSILSAGYVAGQEFTSPDLEQRLLLKRNTINEHLKALRPYGVVELIEKPPGPFPARWKLVRSELDSRDQLLPESDRLRAWHACESSPSVESSGADSSPEAPRAFTSSAEVSRWQDLEGIPI